MSEEQQHIIPDNVSESGLSVHAPAPAAGSLNSFSAAAATTTLSTEDQELERMKSQIEAMEKESAKLVEMQSQLEKNSLVSQEDKADIDARSVYVGNVDYGATPEELKQHFQASGASPINRVTILLDKISGHPKGFAYIEFSDPTLVNEGLKLNESIFRSRQLKVTRKRTNIPGLNRGRGRGRGRGFRGRGFRGGYRGRGGFNPY
ncbi:hypothetical protein DASC09_002890 [Saccharomycopsis crataegensis]|uniref:RRM domain-containing protein n=1 Tax=Saccharomycopsis crataegensis TaxID=43959 RepID=A0AAV5QE13_9ASCO|nr:hypothetical protein DASC09_002890 [Saccharomycopsis crataegensis]